MHTNHLANEKSPYLLQHAHNPVDWYPWGSDAFEKARREDKPVFLSIGYSTCHWCHVMERESFESDEIAGILNESFVPIKVDREERPDVDRIYMTFVQATTGGGGWPMSVWLTPDLKPFFGGTYFPPDNRQGHAGFATILQRIAEAWRQDHDQIVASSTDVVEQLRRHVEVTGGGASGVDEGVLERGFLTFRRMFDPAHGGFGGAPKFPRPSTHNFLVRHYARAGNREALEMVLTTLGAMARGGMNDHLGGGFHRYSVDDHWFVPHFEKMLYDQAQLAVSYLEAFQIAGEAVYSESARRTLDYVLRDMRSPEGGFYSAEDADSAPDAAHPDVKGEGAFYIWTQAEVEAVAGAGAAEWFCYRYGVEPEGNVASDPHGEFTGRNILHQAHSLVETARHFSRPLAEMRAALAEAEGKLMEARSHRPRPHLDDKILTAWNGLMISALALGGAVLSEPAYARAARDAAAFVNTRLYDPATGLLRRRYRAGEAAISGFLDDYAFFAQALLDLYETGFDRAHFELALALTEKMRELFEDPAGGGFFGTAAGDASLVMRMKEDYDGAEPSGNSIAILNLLRLARMTGRTDLRESAERTVRAFASRLAEAPAGLPQMLAACEFLVAPPREIVIVGDKSAPDTEALLGTVAARFVPNKIVLLVEGEDTRRALADYLPSIRDMGKLNGKASAYVCENYTCRLPVSEPAQLAELLK